MSQNRFVVEHKSAWQEGGVWDWSMSIAPARDSTATLNDVRSVTYGLHPVFPNPNRVICDRASSFKLEMRPDAAHNQTWGRFDVRVNIAMSDGQREIHVIPLPLTDRSGAPARELLPLPATADFATCQQYFAFLDRKNAHGYAREVLAQAARVLGEQGAATDKLWVSQKRALCTYKDSSLAKDSRLRDAIEILERECGLGLECKDPETLGLGGAVYKRLWESTRMRSNLERSLAYYELG